MPVMVSNVSWLRQDVTDPHCTRKLITGVNLLPKEG